MEISRDNRSFIEIGSDLMENMPNIDNETMNKIKNLVDNGNLSDAISQISPEMIQNFSKMMNNTNNMSNNGNSNNSNNLNNPNNNDYNNTNDFNNSGNTNTLNNSNYINSSNNSNSTNNSNNYKSSNNNINSNNNSGKDNTSNNNTGFDINNIDMNTIMKLSSAFGNSNNKNDPRANLLNSLKPYLRDSKKSKLDNYMNLLNMSKIADILKTTNNLNQNKENDNA